MKKILVLGTNFAGSTAALEVTRKLKKEGIDFKVTVMSPRDQFVYIPSLIWLPFGRRKLSEISFPVSPIFKKKGIDFIAEGAERIFPNENYVLTEKGQKVSYDYLVVTTGAGLNMDVVPGMNNVECIVTPPLAEKCKLAFDDLVKNPGPVIVGATPYASCMGAAYEYLFNMEKELRIHGIRDRAPLLWLTPEPELGHFGIGGIRGGQTMLETFMKLYKIDYRTNARIVKIEPNMIHLDTGEQLPFKMSMLIPSFVGAKPIMNSPEICDEKGFIACHETYQSEKYENIYAAGLAVQVKSPFTNCAVPFGVPKTGFPSDVQGKIVAHNIVEKIKGGTNFKHMSFGKIPGVCIMDAGHKEVIILTDHLFRPRRFELMIPNIFFNIGKRLLEKYMMIKNRNGLSWLP